MIQQAKCIVMDIDGTMCPILQKGQRYEDLEPYEEMIRKLRGYKEAGFYIILYSSRNMCTYEGNMGQITANTAKFTMAWLDRHNIPYDEIYFGKPWAGKGGFYIDDKTIRPDEFLKLTYEEIEALING